MIFIVALPVAIILFLLFYYPAMKIGSKIDNKIKLINEQKEKERQKRIEEEAERFKREIEEREEREARRLEKLKKKCQQLKKNPQYGITSDAIKTKKRRTTTITNTRDW